MKPLQSELDYLIQSIKELRRLRRDVGLAEADKFKKEMQEYFRLDSEMMSVFIHDALLRLDATPAGTSSKRYDTLLTQIHRMQRGDLFRLGKQECTFRWHTGRREHPQEGFFEYVYNNDLTNVRSMDYNKAWSLLMEGEMEIHVQR
jgi:hypothetical protein